MSGDNHKKFREKLFNMLPSLKEEEYQAFEDIFVPVTYRAKKLLSRPKQISNELYFINKGVLRLYYISGIEERTVFFAFENQFTGPCRSFMLNEPNHQYFETMEECELLVVKRESFAEAVCRFPNLNILRSMIAEENLFIHEDIVSFLLLNSPEERYRYILQNNSRIISRIPQHMIASMIGISPVSLSRIRQRIFRRP